MPKLLRILATTTVALAALAGSVLPATAQEVPAAPASEPAVETHYGPADWNNCPAGRVCLFSAPSGGGAVWYALRCGKHNLHDFGVANWASSYWSRTGQRIDMYDWGAPTREVYSGGQGNFPFGKTRVYDEMEIIC